jgi:hypothetical protein
MSLTRLIKSMRAEELNGTHVGGRIAWWIPNSRTGETTQRSIRDDETITMITHKKNGNVRVRAGKQGREYELRSDYDVEVLPDLP